MSFSPEPHVQAEREHLRKLARSTGWHDYVADKAERMAAETHGMWKPLADIAPALRKLTGETRD